MADNRSKQFEVIQAITKRIFEHYSKLKEQIDPEKLQDLYKKIEMEHAWYQVRLKEKAIPEMLNELEKNHSFYDECPLSSQTNFSDDLISYRIYFQLKELEKIENIEFYEQANGKLFLNEKEEDEIIYSKSASDLLELAEADQEETTLWKSFAENYQENYLALLKRYADKKTWSSTEKQADFTNILWAQVFLYRTTEKILIDRGFSFMKNTFSKKYDSLSYPEDSLREELTSYITETLESEIHQLLRFSDLSKIEEFSTITSIIKIKAAFSMVTDSEEQIDFMKCFMNIEDYFIKKKIPYDSNLLTSVSEDIYNFIEDLSLDPLSFSLEESIIKENLLDAKLPSYYEKIHSYQKAELYFLKKMFKETDPSKKEEYYQTLLDFSKSEENLFKEIPLTTLYCDYQVIQSIAKNRKFSFDAASTFDIDLVHYRMLSQFRKRLGETLFADEILDDLIMCYDVESAPAEDKEESPIENQLLAENSALIYQYLANATDEFHEVFLSLLHRDFKEANPEEKLRNKQIEYAYCFSLLLEEKLSSFVEKNKIISYSMTLTDNDFVTQKNNAQIMNTFFQVQLSYLLKDWLNDPIPTETSNFYFFHILEAFTATYGNCSEFDPSEYFIRYVEDFELSKEMQLPFSKKILESIDKSKTFFKNEEDVKVPKLTFSFPEALYRLSLENSDFQPTLYENIVITEYQIFLFYKRLIEGVNLSDEAKALDRDYLDVLIKREDHLFSELQKEKNPRIFYRWIAELSEFSEVWCNASFYVVGSDQLVYSRIFSQLGNKGSEFILAEVTDFDGGLDDEDTTLATVSNYSSKSVTGIEDDGSDDIYESIEEFVKGTKLIDQFYERYDETVYLCLASNYQQKIETYRQLPSTDTKRREELEQEIVDLKNYLYFWSYTHPSVEQVTKVLGFAPQNHFLTKFQVSDEDGVLFEKIADKLLFQYFKTLVENNLHLYDEVPSNFSLEEFPKQRGDVLDRICLNAFFSMVDEFTALDFLSRVLPEIEKNYDERKLTDEERDFVYNCFSEYQEHPLSFEKPPELVDGKMVLADIRYFLPEKAKEIVDITEVLYHCRMKMADSELKGQNTTKSYETLWQTYKEYATKEKMWYQKNQNSPVIEEIVSLIDENIPFSLYEEYFLKGDETIIPHRILNYCEYLLETTPEHLEKNASVFAEETQTHTIRSWSLNQYMEILTSQGKREEAKKISEIALFPRRIQAEINNQMMDGFICIMANKVKSFLPNNLEEANIETELSNLYHSLAFTCPNGDHELSFKKFGTAFKVMKTAKGTLYDQDPMKEPLYHKFSSGSIAEIIGKALGLYLTSPDKPSIKIFRRAALISSCLLDPNYELGKMVFEMGSSEFLEGDIADSAEVQTKNYMRVQETKRYIQPKVLKKLAPSVYLNPDLKK